MKEYECKFDQSKEDIGQLATHSQRNILAASSDDGKIELFDYQNLKYITNLQNGHTNICSSIVFHSNNETLISGGMDYRLCLWDLKTKKLKKYYSIMNDAKDVSDNSVNSNQACNPPFINSLDLSPDGRHLLAALGDGTLRFYDAKTLNFINSFHGHSVPINQAFFISKTTGKSLILSSASDSLVLLWDVLECLSRNSDSDYRKKKQK